MWMAAGGVLLALLAAGVGIPIPEDLTLLGAGYLAWRGDAPLWLMWLTGFAGIVAGDSSLYWIGRKLGPRISRHRWLSHRLTPARRQRIEAFLARHGSKSVLLARFAAGARGAFYLTAGSMGMRYRRFLVFDALAALMSATLWGGLGWRFGNHIDYLRHTVKRVEHWAAAAALAIVVVWIVTRLVRRWIEGPPEPRPPAPA
jgi:membrane protein DedA with SNARE-associated domain